MNNPQDRRSPDRPGGRDDRSQSGDWRSRQREYSKNFQSDEWFSRGYLPHRGGSNLIQHVTFHLADSLPKSAIERIEQSLISLPEKQRNAERRKRVDEWMDAGHGACVLKHPEIAETVQSSLLHFNNERYSLHAWVVMPNHVHVLFQPINDWPLAKIVASWKKFTARKIKNLLTDGTANLPIGPPWAGPIWHREYWDRYIRDEDHYVQTVEYIHHNPVAAGLAETPEAWTWSSAKSIFTGVET